MWLHCGTYIRHSSYQNPKIRVYPFSITSLSLLEIPPKPDPDSKLGFFHFQSPLLLETLNSKPPPIRISSNSNRHYLLPFLFYSNLRNVKSCGSISYVFRFEFEKKSNYGMQVWRRNNCSNCYRYLQSKLWQKVLGLQKLQKSI